MPKYASNLMYGIGTQELTGDLDMNRMRKERNERLRKIMRKYGCVAMLVGGGDNIRYTVSTTAQALPSDLSYALFPWKATPMCGTSPATWT